MEKLLRISPRLIERRIKEAKDSWDEARAWFPNAPDLVIDGIIKGNLRIVATEEPDVFSAEVR